MFALLKHRRKGFGAGGKVVDAKTGFETYSWARGTRICLVEVYDL